MSIICFSAEGMLERRGNRVRVETGRGRDD